MDITVIPQYRRKGLATKLLTMLIDYAKMHEKTKIEGGFFPIDTEASGIWMDNLGMKHGFTEKVSRLYKNKINWEFIHAKKKKYQEKLSNYRFVRYSQEEWSTKILEDDDFAERMADFFTEVDNLLPREDAEWNDVIITANDLKLNAEKNLETRDIWESINYYAMDGEKIIAMSGTYYPNDPPLRDVGTGLTGVRKDYQRQGLATYLKILVTTYYVENFPEFEYIFTENAGSNEGMLHINYSLGYESLFTWNFYQGQIREVESKFS
jgi:GNAT superfamily N-acetyltransferase